MQVDANGELDLDASTIDQGNVTNDGQLTATVGSSTLSNLGSGSGTGTFTNDGTIEVAASATLVLLDDTLNDTAGTIQIDDSTTLTLSGTTIHGGTINDGDQPNTGGATGGTIHVTGDTTIDSGAHITDGVVNVDAGVTLTLNDVTVDATTINDVSTATIQVDGTHMLTLTNGAAIGDLTVTNDGTIEVAGPATLTNDAVDNSLGTIQVDSSQTLTLNHTAITGGTINDYDASGNGSIVVAGSSSITNANLNNGGVTVNGGKTLTLDNVTVTGTTLNDSGTIKVDANKTLTLAGTDNISGGAFSFGGGSVQPDTGTSVFLSGVSIGYSGSPSTTLTLTIAANNGLFTGGSNTITLTGTLATIKTDLSSVVTYYPGNTASTLTLTVTDGSNTSFRAYSIDTTNIASPTIHVTDASGAIRNANLIDVTGTTTLSNDTLFNGATVQVDVTDRLKLDHTGVFGGTITDNGTIEIVGRAAINNASLTIDNTTGQVTVDASSLLKMGGDTVTGGTINNAAGGSEEITSSSTITGTTINNGGVTIDAGQTLTLSGATIHNATINDGTVPNTGGATGGTIHVTGDTTIDSGAHITDGVVNVDAGVTLTLNDVTVDATTINDVSTAIIQVDSTHMLTLTNGAAIGDLTVTNDGTIEVAGPATLTNDVVDNSLGTIQVDSSQTLTLNHTAITGGTINDYDASGNGSIVVAGSSSITNANLNNGGVTVNGGKTLTLDNVTVTGTTLNDSGTIKVDANKTLTLAGTDNISGGAFSFGGGSVQPDTGTSVFLSGVSIGYSGSPSTTLTLTIAANNGLFTGGSNTITLTGTLATIKPTSVALSPIIPETPRVR